MPFEVSKDVKIGELVLNCPAAMEVLLNHGFHCVGCGLSAFETLEEGAKAHGYSDEDVAKMVEEIKAASAEFERIAAASDIEDAKRREEERKLAEKLEAEKEEAIWKGRALPGAKGAEKRKGKKKP